MSSQHSNWLPQNKQSKKEGESRNPIYDVALEVIHHDFPGFCDRTGPALIPSKRGLPKSVVPGGKKQLEASQRGLQHSQAVASQAAVKSAVTIPFVSKALFSHGQIPHILSCLRPKHYVFIKVYPPWFPT